MKHAARIALVMLGSAAYAPLLVIATTRLFGGQNLQALFDWVVGRGCGGECHPVRNLVFLGVILVLAATLPVLAWTGILWIRRARRSDIQVQRISTFMRQPRDWSPVATSDIEPEVPRFYRDRQGRLRPMEQSPPD